MKTDTLTASWPEVEVPKKLQRFAKSVHNVTVPPGVKVGDRFEHRLSEILGCELHPFH